MKKIPKSMALGLLFSLGFSTIPVAAVGGWGYWEAYSSSFDSERALERQERAQRKKLAFQIGGVAVFLATIAKSAYGTYKYNQTLNDLKKQFPTFAKSSLEVAASAKLLGLNGVITQIAWSKLKWFKRPFEALKNLAQEEQTMIAVAAATGVTPEQARQAFESASYRQLRF